MASGTGVELTDESIRLVELRPARRRTVVVLGHESDGIPEDATALLDTAVEIPMIGTGLSLNVAVAGFPGDGPTGVSLCRNVHRRCLDLRFP